uniref:Uncharacterized protein n=1 Tax=Chromera velia CCMP2878 TaxID=1169474 RepID=A0A0G4G4T4_9ALVE|eukprot:Cvel_20261.t1-p1 / transcript=Cvel_20261.t1 / gene=Cvel_20261 / organism=Chromera_velia_CCMP2878 / gene_product=hypothetical protein / transcript_product=hypothetical protein / location=Cvel_scaffold1807:28586-34402(-) / protein_length=889 / sequence_SO=supercontig / SO=protein_coding / is_pseudo=false
MYISPSPDLRERFLPLPSVEGEGGRDRGSREERRESEEATRRSPSPPASLPQQTRTGGEGGKKEDERRFLLPPKLFFRNVFVLTYVVLFCIEGARGIFIGTVYSFARYLEAVDGKNIWRLAQIVSLSTSLFSLGRISSSTWLGSLSDRSGALERRVHVWCSWLAVLSCLAYILSVDFHSVELFLFSRYILGFSTGCLSSVRAHLARITSFQQRTKYLAVHGMTQYGALAIAPFFALGAAWLASSEAGSALSVCGPVATLKEKTGGGECSWAAVVVAWVFNGFTAPGVILICFNLVNVVLFLTVFTPVSAETLAEGDGETARGPSGILAVGDADRCGESPVSPAEGSLTETATEAPLAGEGERDRETESRGTGRKREICLSETMTMPSPASQTRLAMMSSRDGGGVSVTTSRTASRVQSMSHLPEIESLSTSGASFSFGAFRNADFSPCLSEGKQKEGKTEGDTPGLSLSPCFERQTQRTPSRSLSPVMRVMSEIGEVSVPMERESLSVSPFGFSSSGLDEQPKGSLEEGGGDLAKEGSRLSPCRPRGETIDATPQDLRRGLAACVNEDSGESSFSFALQSRSQPYYLRLLRRNAPFELSSLSLTRAVLSGRANSLDEDFDLAEFQGTNPTFEREGGREKKDEGGDLEGGDGAGNREGVFSEETERRERERKEELMRKWDKIVSRGVGLYMFLNFSARGAVALIEAAGTAMIARMWRVEDHMQQVMVTSLLFGAMGVAGMVTFLVTIWAARKVHEAVLLLCAFLVFGVGAGIVGMASSAGGGAEGAQVVVGLTLIWTLAFPVKNTTLLSSLTKLAGKKAKKRFGSLMGWVGTFGSLGRVLVPLVYLVADERRTFGISVGSCLLCSVLLGAFMWTLLSFKQTHAKDLHGEI